MNAKEMAFDDFDAAMVYSPDTGKVTNKMHRSSRAVKGGPVGVLRWDDDGYLRAKLNKKEYLVHRIAYLLHYGAIHKRDRIYHVNGLRHDNRISNLRLSDRTRLN